MSVQDIPTEKNLARTNAEIHDTKPDHKKRKLAVFIATAITAKKPQALTMRTLRFVFDSGVSHSAKELLRQQQQRDGRSDGQVAQGRTPTRLRDSLAPIPSPASEILSC